MAVAYDNKVSAYANAATTVTTGSFTISASANRVAVLSFKNESSGTITAVTSSCGGQAGAAVSGTQIAAQAGDITVRQHRVIAPASGSQTASFSWTTASYVTLVAATFTSADQTTGTANGNSANGASNVDVPITITSTSGDMAVSISTNTSGTISGDQTELFNDAQVAAHRNTGGGTTLFNWASTAGYMASCGCNVLAVAGGTTIAAGTGALTITGQSVKLDSGIAVGGSSLVITGQTPTVTGATQIAAAGVASLVITGQTPTVTGATQTVYTDAASLVIGGQQVSASGINTNIYARSASPYVYLTWDAAVGATGYEIGYDTDTGDPYTNVLDVGNVLSYLLKPGSGYWYINIRSYDGVSSGSWGTEIEWESDGLYITGQQVSLNNTIQVGSASLVLTAAAQSLDFGIAVPAANLVIDGQQVISGTNVFKDVLAADLVIEGQQVGVQVAENLAIDVDVASLILTAQTPFLDFALETSAASLVINAQQASIAVTENIWKDAGAADLLIDSQQVNVTLGGNLIVEVDVAQLVITSFEPEVSGSDIEEGIGSQKPAGSPSRHKQRNHRKRWVLPNGMHVFGTADQALDIAQSMIEQPVVIRQRRTQKPVVLHLDDGDIEALAIYPTQRASTSSSNDSMISQTQIAEPDWITAEQIMMLLEDRKRRRRKIATLLLLS